MALCLAVATAKEYRALAPLGAPAVRPAGQAISWKRAGRELAVLVTGVGPVAAAATLGRLLGAGGISGVINLGVAGAFDLTHAPLASLVLATAENFPAYGLRGSDGTDPRGLGLPQITLAGEAIYDRLPLDPDATAASLGLNLPQDAIRGAFSTVATVVAGPAADTAPAGILAENMEGFALALACRLAGVPFLELRAVSNRVGARPPHDWDLAGALAALTRAVAALLA